VPRWQRRGTSLIASLPQLLGGIVTERLEKSVTACPVPLLHLNQRFVNHIAQQRKHVWGLFLAHSLSRVEGEAAGEHAQLLEQVLLGWREQVIAPVHQRAQRLVSRCRAPPCRAE